MTKSLIACIATITFGLGMAIGQKLKESGYTSYNDAKNHMDWAEAQCDPSTVVFIRFDPPTAVCSDKSVLERKR